jgi:hypothetical protein
LIHYPGRTDILCNSRTTAGTIITIPAGKVWCGDLMISVSVAAAQTGTPTITVSGANAAPADGTIVHRLSVTGLALSTITDSATIPVIVRAPAGNAVTLEFAATGSTSAAAVANVVLL